MNVKDKARASDMNILFFFLVDNYLLFIFLSVFKVFCFYLFTTCLKQLFKFTLTNSMKRGEILEFNR